MKTEKLTQGERWRIPLNWRAVFMALILIVPFRCGDGEESDLILFHLLGMVGRSPDAAAYVEEPTAQDVIEPVGGLEIQPVGEKTTLEEGGEPIEFRVGLLSRARSPVDVGVVVSCPDRLGASVAGIQFAAGDRATQSVGFFAIEDDSDRPEASCQVRFESRSDDENYDGISQEYSLDVRNNDRADILIEKLTEGVLRTGEDGSETGFYLNLATRPTGVVVFRITSTDPTEGEVGLSRISFHPEDWDGLPRTETIRGVDDSEADGVQEYAIRVEIDAANTLAEEYLRMANQYSFLRVENMDND